MTSDSDSSSSSKPTDKSKTAGGFFIAAGSIAGVLVGGVMGQPTIGLFAGIALGGLVAVAIWLMDR